MSDTVISPNMNLPVPVVGVDTGPDWANNINACLSAIDSHNHSAGQGVQITPDGLDINDDLAFGGNDATALRSVRFTAQGSPLAGASDLGCVYESGVDLYYNDGNGNQVRITQSGSVTGSSGTITGLPSGTASASYSAGTFTFQSATNTPATMAVGPLVIGSATVSPHTTTFGVSSSQASNLNITLPITADAAHQVLIADGSGNLSWSLGLLPIGSVVATFPNLSGAYTTSATTSADAYGFVKCNGQTIADGTSPMNGAVVPNINNTVFLAGNTTAGSSGGAATVTLSSANLAAHTHTFTSSTLVTPATHFHTFDHDHQTAYETSAGGFYMATSSSASTSTWTTGAPGVLVFGTANVTLGASTGGVFYSGNTNATYTSGVLNAPSGSIGSSATSTASSDTAVSGTTNSTGSGTAFSILPTYITSVYLMRIK